MRILTAPFCFKNRLMEERYQHHFISSSVDRVGPIMLSFWLPALMIMRCFWSMYWLFNPFKIRHVEVVVGATRFFFKMVMFVVLSKKWDLSAKCKIGLLFLWMTRTVGILVAVQQAAAKANDPLTMSGLVGYVCLSGLMIPRFTEYLCTALPLPLIQPIRLYFSGNKAEHIHEILFQHTLILALGLSITWTIHADCRRDWLRFLPPQFANAVSAP